MMGARTRVDIARAELGRMLSAPGSDTTIYVNLKSRSRTGARERYTFHIIDAEMSKPVLRDVTTFVAHLLDVEPREYSDGSGMRMMLRVIELGGDLQLSIAFDLICNAIANDVDTPVKLWVI